MKFGLKTIVNYFLYNKKTGEKLVEVDISNDETPIIELGDQFNINVDVDANTFLKAVAFSGEIERLHKIQSRTKKQRTKNKLQKRIDTYEK
ncbi:hypothetical protein [Paenibacillus sp. FSL E2-0178]|uniref:hypothetical protein n=1 Tax=Paenibacillus sp. FSL E2-0178 TaxID=2921361 RepID=UPI003158DA84